MTSSNEKKKKKPNPGNPWIPLTKASDAGLWCFLWCATEQTVMQTTERPVIWDAMAIIATSQSLSLSTGQAVHVTIHLCSEPDEGGVHVISVQIHINDLKATQT